MLTFFLVLSYQAEVKEAVICICPASYCSWSSGDKCYNTQETLDPRESDFFEKFEDARNGNRNVVIGLYASYGAAAFDFPLKYLRSMNIYVTSTYSSYNTNYPGINFVYSSSDDVSTLNLTLDKCTANFINSDREPSELLIRIGHLRTNGTRTRLNFIQNGNAPIKLSAKTLNMLYDNILSLSSITLTDDSYLSLSANLDFTSKISINNNGMIINELISVTANKFDLVGSNRGIVNLTVAEGATPPLMNISSISQLYIYGTWTHTQRSSLANVGSCNVFGPSFPFDVTGSLIIYFDQDITIDGTFLKPSYSVNVITLGIGTSAKQNVNVHFKGEVQSLITLYNGYIQAEFDYLHYSTFSYGNLPIGISVSENSISNIKINRLEFDDPVTANQITLYGDIDRVLSDSEISGLGLYDGVAVIQFPNISFLPSSYSIAIATLSPSQTSKVPGFCSTSNTLSATATESAGTCTITLRSTSPFDKQWKVFYRSSSYQCSSSGADVCLMSLTTARESLKDLVGNGIVPAGMRNIYFDFYAALDVNLSSLDPSTKDFTVIVKGNGNSYNTGIEYDDKLGLITNLTLSSLRVSQDINLTMNHLKFDNINFLPEVYIMFGAETTLISDISSIGRLYVNKANMKLSEVIIAQSGSEYVFSYNATCLEMYQKTNNYGYGIPYDKFPDKLTYNITNAHFNLDVSTNSPDQLPGYTVNMMSTSSRTLTYYGDWSTINTNIVINHYETPLVVVYSRPGQGKGVEMVGTGQVSYSVQYDSEVTYCIYQTESTECIGLQQYRIKQSNFSQRILDDDIMNTNALRFRLAELDEPIHYYRSISFTNRFDLSLATQGNQANVMDLKTVDNDDGYLNVYLNKTKMPSEVPFIIDYLKDITYLSVTGELVIYENKNIAEFDDLPSNIPPVLHSIVLNLTTDMSRDHPFRLNEILGASNRLKTDNEMNITVIGTSGQRYAVIDVPRSGNQNLVFTNIKIDMVSIIDNTTIDDPHYITCNSLSIVDCDVYENRDFYINDEHVNSLSLDIDTLSTTINNQVLQRPFKNNVKLTAANIINFTSAGWIFKEISFKDEADISESDFPSVTFETNRDVKLTLEPGITQIRSITINSLPRNGSDSLRFFFSSGWGKITNQQDLKINTNNLGIHVITASFPIPQVFDHNDDITFEFQPDDDNKFDPPKYDSGKWF